MYFAAEVTLLFCDFHANISTVTFGNGMYLTKLYVIPKTDISTKVSKNSVF